MKSLDTKEWIAVVVAVFVVGFFFVFGQLIVSIFRTNKTESIKMEQPQVNTQDVVFGSGAQAQTGDRVVVHYTGRLQDGRIFDSSVNRNEPFQFILGIGQVIRGWDEGIVGMRVGGKRTITVPPEYGYGMSDYGPIPGGSTLIFDVELLKVENPQ